jgi:hypothetical protein
VSAKDMDLFYKNVWGKGEVKLWQKKFVSKREN